jgi:hypothetical protein
MTVSKRTAGFHRIGQLNPYDSDWVLKAKLDRKVGVSGSLLYVNPDKLPLWTNCPGRS